MAWACWCSGIKMFTVACSCALKIELLGCHFLSFSAGLLVLKWGCWPLIWGCWLLVEMATSSSSYKHKSSDYLNVTATFGVIFVI